MDERAGKRRSWPGPRRRNDKPERRRGRLGKSRLAQEEEGPPGLKRAPVQASCRGEVEPARVPSDFEEYRRKGLQPRRLLGDPERILELAGPGEKDGFRADAETLMKARKIGEARFAEDVRRADPEERPVRSLLHEKARQSQGEAGYRSGVARLPAMQLDKAGAWPSAAENPVERISSRAQKGRASSCGRHAVVACEDAVFVRRPAGRRIQPIGKDPFDLGDFPAQGENGLPRHGAFNHGDIDLAICSCYVLMDSRGGLESQADSSGPKEEFIPLPCAMPKDPRIP